MLEYLDTEYLQTELESIFKSAINEMVDEDNKNLIETEFGDEFIEERSVILAEEFNADMKKYLHQNNHRIDGNFNNVNYDYNNHINGEVEFNDKLLADLIQRLDNNQQDAQTKSDRHWLVDWFFETFGSWGLKYNLQTEISEYLYYAEQENAA